jgi:hypothetical protein
MLKEPWSWTRMVFWSGRRKSQVNTYIYIWINRGLLFVGGCEDKDLQKPMDGDPSDGANEGWGGRSLSHHGDRLPPMHCSENSAATTDEDLP